MEAEAGLGETGFAQKVFSLPRTDAAITTYNHPGPIMSVNFTIRNFFHPVAIVKLRRAFERSQWFTPEQFDRYQEKQLRRIVEHAHKSEEHTSELQSRQYLVCRLLLEKKKIRS